MASPWIRLGGDAMEDKNITDILDSISSIIGDTPVSEQVDLMMRKPHYHDEYVLVSEFNKLKKGVERLASLVGDMSVSDQINKAINK